MSDQKLPPRYWIDKGARSDYVDDGSGEVLAQAIAPFSTERWVYNGRTFISLESAKRAIEKDFP